MVYDGAIDFREDEEAVLKTLSTASDGEVSFTGMRRALGMHQEKPSRILRRLEKHGLVDRGSKGYRLSGKARKLVNARGVEKGFVIVDTRVEDVGLVLAGVTALHGRWVDEMRWLGYSVENDAHVLRWISQDGELQITLRLKDGRLTISSNRNERRAVRAALAILRKAYELALIDDTSVLKTLPTGFLNTAA
ncbi:MAG: hypothetical protein NYU05_03070 [Aigarchaeota archaeon]|nr:hypothetical protein [Candidatus Caldarchaeales archaeon]